MWYVLVVWSWWLDAFCAVVCDCGSSGVLIDALRCWLSVVLYYGFGLLPSVGRCLCWLLVGLIALDFGWSCLVCWLVWVFGGCAFGFAFWGVMVYLGLMV